MVAPVNVEDHTNTTMSSESGPGVVPESLSTTPHSSAPYSAFHKMTCE